MNVGVEPGDGADGRTSLDPLAKRVDPGGLRVATAVDGGVRCDLARWRFGDVATGQPLAYMNSLDRFAFALNMGDFARTHHVSAGPRWTVSIERAR